MKDANCEIERLKADNVLRLKADNFGIERPKADNVARLKALEEQHARDVKWDM
jgi:hypothetical protein